MKRALQVTMRSEVIRQIRQHARSSMKSEVCGVLIGRDRDTAVAVDACIAGENAAQAGAHVTFTQDTWEHIYKIKDREYPSQRIVGWYHSHPGFGIFLSEHDQFIQQNFFSAATQIAWVYDPHSDEEGCFGWCSGKIERLPGIRIKDDGTAPLTSIVAQETGDPPTEMLRPISDDRPRWTDTLFTVLSYVAIFALGGLLAFMLLPERTVIVPVTPEQAEQLLREHNQLSTAPQQDSAAGSPAQKASSPEKSAGQVPSKGTGK